MLQKCSCSIVKAWTYVREFGSITNCLQCQGAGVCNSQTILTKWHPVHKYAGFTISYSQSRHCKTLQHSIATGVLLPASILTGSILHSTVFFALKNFSVRGWYWKFVQISLFNYLNFIPHNTFTLNEISTGELTQDVALGTSSSDERKMPHTRGKHYVGHR